MKSFLFFRIGPDLDDDDDEERNGSCRLLTCREISLMHGGLRHWLSCLSLFLSFSLSRRRRIHRRRKIDDEISVKTLFDNLRANSSSSLANLLVAHCWSTKSSFRLSCRLLIYRSESIVVVALTYCFSSEECLSFSYASRRRVSSCRRSLFSRYHHH